MTALALDVAPLSDDEPDGARPTGTRGRTSAQEPERWGRLGAERAWKCAHTWNIQGTRPRDRPMWPFPNTQRDNGTTRGEDGSHAARRSRPAKQGGGGYGGGGYLPHNDFKECKGRRRAMGHDGERHRPRGEGWDFQQRGLPAAHLYRTRHSTRTTSSSSTRRCSISRRSWVAGIDSHKAAEAA